MVNEKTLELNLCHEIMHLLGTAGYDSLLMGLNQLQEEAHGFDAGFVSISRVFLLQFKRGWKRNRWISFRLNDNSRRNQHDRLLFTCSGTMGICYYALPRICSWTELVASRGRLLRATVFYDAVDVPIPAGDRKAHAVRLHGDDSIEVLSEPKRIRKPVEWHELLRIPSGDDHPEPRIPRREPPQPAQPGTPLSDFLERIERVDMSPREKAQVRLLLISPRHSR